MQLTPTIGSTMLDDLDLIGRGNLNLRDCWTEVERSYAVLVSMCHRSCTEVSSNLPTLALPAVDGQGILLPALERFTSLDYRRGVLIAEIDGVLSMDYERTPRLSLRSHYILFTNTSIPYHSTCLTPMLQCR